ncbi:ABC transporter ATP-binding protein [Nitratifractor salsuginis]|uniref:ABC transporter related protein n=1 Tax=Nitratifractor salsuginis (strain DSM 16511 / JCM 12458 / E9I37-1) TaxID=749222 RepID=E6X0R9_NITSE|nr:ABC transporter ATP-binding protein [Nitratifractor salsuginis]ADV45789.1 ABC transporter related protein [Nitratifractor salsuginis DSM 16511]
MSAIIEIRGLNRHFKTGEEEFHALKDIDLSVERGECVILRGISGSGKTTLLSIIAGLDHPSSGELIVEGERIAKLPDRHLSRFRGRHIGMIFQHYNLMEHLRVSDNVSVPLIPMGLTMEEVDRRVTEAMELANIAHKADQNAGYLSGGEKQRVAIARALAADPEIILCDEPTANLDRANARRFLEILAKLHELGKTILIATHDPIFEELPFEARMVEMENGIIVGRR